MRRTIRLAALAAFSLVLTVGTVARAADPVPGAQRAINATGGAALRATPNSMGAMTGSLQYGKRVVVNEVRGTWVKVTEVVNPGQPAMSGWVQASQLIEPERLQTTGPRVTAAGSAGRVRADDVSAAGRHFDGPTERAYRANHRELEAAYPFVDEMERATGRLDPQGCIAFIQEGRLGRENQDWDRPPLLPPSPQPPPDQPRGRGDGGGRGIGGLLGGLGEKLGGDTGRRIGETVGAIAKNVAAYNEQMGKRFTPEQEYFLGRAVAANAIAKYGVERNSAMRNYVRLVGDALVRKSTRLPPTFGGYHFEVLDSDEVNGISGPGGFILVTRGAVLACQTEDELAAVLAHELAHTSGRHGETTIREGGRFQAGFKGFVDVGSTASGLNDDRFKGALLNLFETTVGEAIKTSIQDGYGSNLEFQADQEGTYILADVVYDHAAMRDYLRRLQHAHGHYNSAHAPPAVRAQALDNAIARMGATHPTVVELSKKRAERLRAALASR